MLSEMSEYGSDDEAAGHIDFDDVGSALARGGTGRSQSSHVSSAATLSSTMHDAAHVQSAASSYFTAISGRTGPSAAVASPAAMPASMAVSQQSHGNHTQHQQQQQPPSGVLTPGGASRVSAADTASMVSTSAEERAEAEARAMDLQLQPVLFVFLLMKVHCRCFI